MDGRHILIVPWGTTFAARLCCIGVFRSSRCSLKFGRGPYLRGTVWSTLALFSLLQSWPHPPRLPQTLATFEVRWAP